MSAGGSTKVIIISLIANFGIAVSKLVGSFITGSAALLAEAVHSFSDCGNQMLLLYGQHVAKKAPSEKYPLGRAKESFFWSFIVALLLFSMGGMFSFYEGMHKIQHPEALSYPLVGISILVLAIILEGGSFWACYQEVRKQNTFGSLWQWIRRTTSADLLVIFLEDLAALLGLVFALAALVMSWITGNSLWDGLGSCVIGVLLIAVAVILAQEVKSLLVGEVPTTDYRKPMETLLAQVMPKARLMKLIALQQGVGSVLLAYKIHPGDEPQDTHATIGLVNSFEAKVKQQFPEIHWQFAELDVVE